MRRSLLLLLILTALVMCARAVIAQEGEEDDRQGTVQEGLWGKIVRKVTFDLPPWMSDKEIKHVCKIKEDKTLSRWRVRSTIRRTYLLGYVQNVLVKAEAAGPDGVKVIVKIYPRYLIRDFTIKGNFALSDDEIIEDVLKLQSGDDYLSEDLPVYEEKIRKAYRDIGHLEAKVRVSVELTKRKLDNKADLTVAVDEGPAYKVDFIDISGDYKPFNRRKLLGALKWRIGMTYEKKRIDDGLDRLKGWMKDRRHYEARVSDIGIGDDKTVHIDAKNKTMQMFLRVDAGPRIEIDYDNECFTCAQKKWKMAGQLDVENNRRFTRYILQPFSRKIEEYFRQRGYLDATVRGEYEEALDEKGQPVKRLKFFLDKGQKYSIEEIDFKNNPTFADSKLQKALEPTAVFDPDDFDKRLENVVSFYNRNGFIRAKIAQKTVDIDEATGRIAVSIVVYEGPQAFIRNVSLDGNKFVGEKVFRNTLAGADLVTGRPYNPFLVADVKTRMLAKYLTRGYIKARILDRVDISEDGTQVDVSYAFDEGKEYKFGNVYVHGNKLTKQHVITRELFITSGDPFNYEDIFASQQQLMKLGFFNSVDITQVNPDLDEEVIDLVVTVDERNSGYILSGLGYDTYNGYKGAFELGHKNLAGHGRSISFRTDVGFREQTFRFDQRTVSVGFGWPWIARVPADGQLTIVDDQRRLIGYAVRELANTATVMVDFPKFFYHLEATKKNQTLRSLSKYWSGQLSYSYVRDFIFDIAPSVSDQELGEVRIASLTPKVIRDSRDNPFSPVTGKVYMASIEWGAPILLSEIAYMKTIGQLSWIIPVFRWWSEKKDAGIVLALNAKAGHAQVLRKTDTLPINRRFYLGGSTTIRGFGQDQISPMAEDGRTPVGGMFFGYTNVEFRVPIVESFGATVFFDAGDVTNQVKEFYIDKLRATSGLGLNYLTPVGPISVIYGFKLNRNFGESPGEFYITVGNAF